ncbi:trace amine-associated receptor 1-like [Rhinatrema bivittatum]|uniref:trace amine-associated receptor 1-like n=1 Tax=Rhinatrema bivittatum TaxID=194408 RepID=UPI0011274B13|nr:trace amine-associated receptor 1-like [Rhinatrema bivittatum]
MELFIIISHNGLWEAELFCYESLNDSCLKAIRSNRLKVLFYIPMMAVILITLCGNLLIIISIAHFKQLHTPTNYLILSLATVDLLLSITVMPYSMVRSIETCWYFGKLFCKIHSSIDVMLSTASILHLSCISIDRLYAVCDPLKYRLRINERVVAYLIFMSWVTSAITGFGMIFLGLNLKGEEDFYNKNIDCEGECIFFLNKASAIVSSAISFYIPGLIMICIYGKIFAVAKKQANSLHDNQMERTKLSRVSQKRERKAAKTLGIVMGVFLTCWFPCFICNIADPLLGYTVLPAIIDALVWFGYLNSTLNPIVYAFFYAWFRKALLVIVSGKIFQANSSRILLYDD